MLNIQLTLEEAEALIFTLNLIGGGEESPRWLLDGVRDKVIEAGGLYDYSVLKPEFDVEGTIIFRYPRNVA